MIFCQVFMPNLFLPEWTDPDMKICVTRKKKTELVVYASCRDVMTLGHHNVVVYMVVDYLFAVGKLQLLNCA